MIDIVIACDGGPNYFWNGFSIDNGIGGSEECLIMLAQAFAGLGHRVTVFNNCDPSHLCTWLGPTGGTVVYIPFSEFAGSSEPDTADLLISWRNWYLLKGRKAKVKLHSTHDIPVGCHAPAWEEIVKGETTDLDGIVFLNDYHRRLHPWIEDFRAHVIPIGINSRGYEKGVWCASDVPHRDPLRVLYFSHPDRGLDNLRACWPAVRAAHPEATLASFWWEPAHFRASNEAIGILPMASIGSLEAARQTRMAGVFGYPCVFSPEISPATTIRAQMGGCYPCVVEQGGMVDTVKYGIKTNHACFTDRLIETLTRSKNGELEEERKEMMAWAQKKYSWPLVARQWLALLGVD